jgi:hypothetical protein
LYLGGRTISFQNSKSLVLDLSSKSYELESRGFCSHGQAKNRHIVSISPVCDELGENTDFGVKSAAC